MPDVGAVAWCELRRRAIEAASHAQPRWSGLKVGAAAIAELDGQTREITGCNVENASYGLTLCAECGLVSALHASGGGRITHVSIVAGDGAPLMPCGRCRQLLYEEGGGEVLVDDDPAPVRLAELLPRAFTSDDVRRRREPPPP